MEDATWSHDLYSGPQRCVRKTYFTYFVTLGQCKITRPTAFKDDIKYQDLIYYYGWKEPMKRT